MLLLRARHLLSFVALLLAGCASSGPTPSLPAAGLTGSIHGGQQPVPGVALQLYAVGTTGDGSPATPLFANPLLSDTNGDFVFPTYTCPSRSSLVFLTGTGGQPIPGITNPQFAEMAALGPCGNLSSSTFINVNEVTTVAAVYALAPYISSPTAIGSGSSDASALSSAFALASQYANTSTGQTPGTNVPTGYTVPTMQIATVANLLATCINSAGGSSGDSTACGFFFALTKPSGGTTPTNAIAALLNLADNPTLNTAALYNSIPPTAPFQPMDPTQPPDLSIYLLGQSSITLTPSTGLSFYAGIGTTSTQTATLTNNGPSPVSLSVAVTGAVANDFSQTSNCPSTLVATASCTITVAFSPTNTTYFSATLVVTSNASNSPSSISLSGYGNPGYLTVNPGSITVPPSPVGTPSTPQQVVLSNGGSGYGFVTLGSFTFTGSSASQFSQTNNCPAALAPSASCIININATPTFPGALSATLNISGNASNPLPTVALTGTGSGVPLVLSDSGLYVPEGGTATLGVTNSGTSSITISSIVASAGFSQNSTCSPSLAPAATCIVTLSTTSTSATPVYGTVTVSTSSPTTVQAATLATAAASYVRRYGSAAVGYASTNTSINLCQQGANYCTATIAYSGPNASDFSSGGTSCFIRLPSSCYLTTYFIPSSVGTRLSTLTDNSSSYPVYTYLLVGTGLPANSQTISYTSSASSIALGPGVIGVSASQSITLTNTGSAVVTFSSIAVTATYPNNAPPFTQTNTCSAGIPVGGTCTVTVSSTGSIVGDFPATLTLVSNSLTPTLNIPVDYQTIAPVVTLGISSYNVTLPSSPVGTASQAQTVTLTNTGNVSVYVSVQPYPPNTYPQYFTYSTTCGSQLAVAATCTITINATPGSVGTSSFLLQVTAYPPGSGSVVTKLISVSVTGY